jgi:hypothetical protein
VENTGKVIGISWKNEDTRRFEKGKEKGVAVGDQ